MLDGSRKMHLRGLALSAVGMVVLSPDALLLRLVHDAGIWEVVFYRTRIAARTWISILVAIDGVAVILAQSLGGGGWRGDLMALGVAVACGLNLVIMRPAGRRDMTPAVCLSGFPAAVVALPLIAPASVTGHDLVVLGLLGLVVLPLAFSLVFRGTHYVPAVEVALLALIETALGPLWAWIGVGETPTPGAFVGALVVVGAIVANSVLALRGKATGGVLR